MRLGRPHRQKVSIAGFSAIKLGAPSPLTDVCHGLMQMSWTGFVLLVSVVFVLLDLAFGSLYASLPGAIGGMPPGSIANGFFFLVETLGTVATGTWRPPRCWGTVSPPSRSWPASSSPPRSRGRSSRVSPARATASCSVASPSSEHSRDSRRWLSARRRGRAVGLARACRSTKRPLPASADGVATGPHAPAAARTCSSTMSSPMSSPA